MGFFGQILMSTSRVIESYEVDFVENYPEVILVAKELKRILDATKVIDWGSEYLLWFTYNEGNNSYSEASSIELKAYFYKEYGHGEKVYYDEKNNLLMHISRFGEKLILQSISNDGDILVSITINLIKK